MLFQNFLLNLHVKTWRIFGHSYTNFDIQKSDGQLFVVGMKEVGAADAQTQLEFFQEILGGVCNSLKNKDEIIRNTFINIKIRWQTAAGPPKK